MYIISYNNISRPVHDPLRPHPHDHSAQNLGVLTPTPRIDAPALKRNLQLEILGLDLKCLLGFESWVSELLVLPSETIISFCTYFQKVDLGNVRSFTQHHGCRFACTYRCAQSFSTKRLILLKATPFKPYWFQLEWFQCGSHKIIIFNLSLKYWLIIFNHKNRIKIFRIYSKMKSQVGPSLRSFIYCTWHLLAYSKIKVTLSQKDCEPHWLR